MLGFSSQPDHPALRRTPRAEQLEERAVPALVANPDTYFVQAGSVLTVPFTEGVLVNDFSDDPNLQGFRLSAGVFKGAFYVGNPRPLPLPNLFLNIDGGF